MLRPFILIYFVNLLQNGNVLENLLFNKSNLPIPFIFIQLKPIIFMKKFLTLILPLAFMAFATTIFAQTPPPPPPPPAAAPATPPSRPSPMFIDRAFVGDSYVKIHYSAPSKKGREIFGALIPYGKIWRTGANEGTEITLTKDILVAGQRLPAGTYTIFTTPNETNWKIHFSPQLMLWDTGRSNRQTRQFTQNVYDPAQDVLVVTVPVGSIAADAPEVETFKISVTAEKIELTWVRTQITIPIAAAN